MFTLKKSFIAFLANLVHPRQAFMLIANSRIFSSDLRSKDLPDGSE